MKLQVIDKTNSSAGDIEVSDKVFGCDVKSADALKKMNNVVYEAIKNQLANRRQGTADTQTRGDVTATTKKPWRQKGTGRARSGSSKSPLWKGGGTIFGPHPRDYSYKLHKKVKRQALFSVLSTHLADGNLKVLEDFIPTEYKTKAIDDVFSKISSRKKVLFIMNSDERDSYEILRKSAGNLQYLKIVNSKAIEIKDLFYADEVVLLKSSAIELNQRYAS